MCSDYRVGLAFNLAGGFRAFAATGDKRSGSKKWLSVVYNKMQRILPNYGIAAAVSGREPLFIFYIRNPVRVHLSHKLCRKHDPRRMDWSDTHPNFLSLLTETREILDGYEQLRKAIPASFSAMNFFVANTSGHFAVCIDSSALNRCLLRIHATSSGIADAAVALFTLTCQKNQEWLICPRHRRAVCGCGRFNPLAAVDRGGRIDDSWKRTPNIECMMSDLRHLLGISVADYFWKGDYAGNLFFDTHLINGRGRSRKGFTAGGGRPARRLVAMEVMNSQFRFSSASLGAMAKNLRAEYSQGDPFPHIVIDSFLPEPLLARILDEFPDPRHDFWERRATKNSLKLSCNDLDDLGPTIQHVLEQFNGRAMLRFLERLTGIEHLIPDALYEGGGLHQILPGGFLKIHADFNKHPEWDLDRRLNVILFLNRDWSEDYGGHFELWDCTMAACRRKVLPVFNRLVVFSTTDTSYHGHPDPLRCPREDREKASPLTTTPTDGLRPIRPIVTAQFIGCVRNEIGPHAA